MVIKGDRQKSDKAAGIIRPDILKLVDIPDNRIANYVEKIIAMKGAKKSI